MKDVTFRRAGRIAQTASQLTRKATPTHLSPKRRNRPQAAVLALALGAFATGTGWGAAPAFPLKVSSNHRFLVDQHDTPFLIQSDTPWSIIVALTDDEVARYLDNRKQRGFNALWLGLIEHKWAGADNPYGWPRNRRGEGPFTKPNDFSFPNDAYFKHADWVIDQAAQRGMVVFLTPCYLGFSGTDEGWWKEVLANGTEKCRAYGRYVGTRYRGKPNIIWLMYGDRDPDQTQPMVEAMATGIRETDPTHLFTAHLHPESNPRELLTGSQWLDLNIVYTYLPSYAACVRARAMDPPMPFLLFETAFEGEHESTPARTRAQAYWALLSGGCGQGFGNRPMWLFDRGWQSALDSVGSNDMERVSALFLSRRWTNLVPDTEHTAVRGDLGNGWKRITAARTSDGETVIAYLPVGGAVTVDLSKISGTKAKAWWYDPRTGCPLVIGVFPTKGVQEFKAPTGEDWSLVVDDNAQGPSEPGRLPRE